MTKKNQGNILIMVRHASHGKNHALFRKHVFIFCVEDTVNDIKNVSDGQFC